MVGDGNSLLRNRALKTCLVGSFPTLSAMIKLTSDDQVWITGRGKVFTFDRDPDRDFDPRDIKPGQEVEIDGKVYPIYGVEIHPVNVERYTLPFGLLV